MQSFAIKHSLLESMEQLLNLSNFIIISTTHSNILHLDIQMIDDACLLRTSWLLHEHLIQRPLLAVGYDRVNSDIHTAVAVRMSHVLIVPVVAFVIIVLILLGRRSAVQLLHACLVAIFEIHAQAIVGLLAQHPLYFIREYDSKPLHDLVILSLFPLVLFLLVSLWVVLHVQ